MFRTFAAAFLITGLVACNKVHAVQAQSSGSSPSYDNLAPAPDDGSQAPYADDDQAPPPDSEAVETSEAPPALPEYDQPPAPGPDYYWTPGYWAWGPGGYYWVPGDWVEAPWIGAVWTPPYWAFDNNSYFFHSGYWGPHVGFYGGIDYGFGYPGRGYYGAYWNGGHLFYNSAVTRINRNAIHNVYRHDVPRLQSSRASFNGGHGGVNFRPTQQERVVTHERRAPAQAAQTRIAQEARQQHNRTNFTARPAPQSPRVAPRPTPQEPRTRPEQPSAPERHEFHPAPHAAPVNPQQQRPAAPVQRQAPQRRPDLQNHLELQQQRPAAARAPRANPQPQQHAAPPAAAPAPRANPQPQQHAAPPAAAPQRGGGGGHGNGGERGGGDRGRGDH